MSPDWAAQAEPVPYAKLDDPQTLNLYGYMRNNPLGGVDADGHDCCDDLLQFVGGVVQGAASSVSFGLVGSPRSSDSYASLAGQALGTSIIGCTGTSVVSGSGPTALGGLALAPETGGASLVVSAGAVGAAAVGSEMAAGAAKNGAAVVVAMAAHGNTAGNQPAELYEKTDKDGNLEKHGVSQDASKRYSKAEVGEGKVTVTDRGPRKEMLAKRDKKWRQIPGPRTRNRGLERERISS